MEVRVHPVSANISILFLSFFGEVAERLKAPDCNPGVNYHTGLNPVFSTNSLRLAHLVERLLWEHEAASSSLATETISTFFTGA